MTPRKLYKYLIREIRRLPNDAQPYYRHFVRQEFNSYSDETEPERINQIIDKAIKDANWLFYTKYGLKKPNNLL